MRNLTLLLILFLSCQSAPNTDCVTTKPTEYVDTTKFNISYDSVCDADIYKIAHKFHTFRINVDSTKRVSVYISPTSGYDLIYLGDEVNTNYYILIRMEVINYRRWYKYFTEHKNVREAYGIDIKYLMRNENNIIMLAATNSIHSCNNYAKVLKQDDMQRLSGVKHIDVEIYTK